MNTSKEYKRLPKVVIAGRPNVGKSTLFNRLLNKRRAITDPLPGVTRDAVQEYCNWDGDEFMLVDTGGYKLENEGSFDDSVSKKSLESMDKADLICFIVETEQVTGEDEALIEHLRPFSDKVILAVNKVDSVEREALVYDFYSYGFSKVLGISASHGRGITELKEEIIGRLKKMDPSQFSEEIDGEHTLSITVLGRPNVGKSTLSNLLTQSKNSIVSAIPGTTRDVVNGQFNYKNQRFRLLDTAGIRKKGKVKENVEYYSVNRAFKAINESDIIYLMVDMTEGLSEQDKKISQQIVKEGKGVIIVLNKWDAIDGDEKKMKEAVEQVRFRFPILGFAPVVVISAKENKRISKLLDKTLEVYEELNHRVDTGELNRALTDWFLFTPIPKYKGKNYKVRYMTQVSAAPVKFILFVNRKKGFPEAYIRFIINNIRTNLSFSQVPIDIQLRES